MIPTYVIGGYSNSITSLDCGLTSWNPFDVIRRYCPVCHKFHDDKEKAPPRVRSAGSPAPPRDPFPDWS